MIIRHGSKVLQEEALRAAASGRPYGIEEAAAFWDSLPSEDGELVHVVDLHWGDIRLLPIMVWSLRDADRYGYHGRVKEIPFFEQLDRIDALLEEANK